MSAQKVKQGYLQKYAKSLIGNSWKKVYVELYKDGSLFWFKKRNDRTGNSISLPRVREYLTVGSYCRAIPFSPTLPSGGNLEHMIAVPQEPNKKSKIHFFLCYSESEFNEWMAAIISTLPSPPATPAGGQPATNPYAPAPYTPFALAPAGAWQAPPSPNRQAAPPVIGFEGLTITANPPPAYSHHPPAVPPPTNQPYCPPSPRPSFPPQPYPQQPSYSPQAPYPQQPSYPPPQQPYPPPQQPYPPPQQAYPPPQQYPQYPYPQSQGYQQQRYPQYQGGQQQYPAQQPRYAPPQQAPTHVTYIQQPPSQTIIVREDHYRGSPGLATGILGGAVAGYAASRMYGGGPCWGGWGHGYGWGHHGSWGSGSWGSGSWGSCSGGSWGSWD